MPDLNSQHHLTPKIPQLLADMHNVCPAIARSEALQAAQQLQCRCVNLSSVLKGNILVVLHSCNLPMVNIFYVKFGKAMLSHASVRTR